MQSAAIAAGILSSLLVGSAVLSAQLGDVAKKEAERRKTVAASGKTYTNDNIKPAPEPSSAPASSAEKPGSESAPAPAPPASSSSSAAPAAPGAKADPADAKKADPADAKKGEAAWRERIKAAREALDRANAFADALQSKINALNTDFVNRDDPVQRSRVAADREKALADMGRLKKEIEQHTKTIASIQDEARRAGVPAGWVR